MVVKRSAPAELWDKYKAKFAAILALVVIVAAFRVYDNLQNRKANPAEPQPTSSVTD